MISAKIIADSIANGVRLTTMELNYPRFIHSEFMTHRMFSRNASSSRAIPVEKMLEQAQENPAIPIHWGKNQPGMQAREEIQNVKHAEVVWGWVISDVIDGVKQLNDLGLHKQVANRLLEPFQYIKVIVTATEWDNFFKLRLHPDAQPEIQELAKEMRIAMYNSEPQELSNGEWHLPYVTTTRKEFDNSQEFWSEGHDTAGLSEQEAINCSIARCARVSYLNHDDSFPDWKKDQELSKRLLEAGHMSPLEHVCTPMQEGIWAQGMTHLMNDGTRWSSNLREWVMYRNIIC